MRCREQLFREITEELIYRLEGSDVGSFDIRHETTASPPPGVATLCRACYRL
jgi:hypothetical protein